MLIEFGQAGLIGKARSQPERVRQVLDKLRTDGVMPTLEAIFSRLDEPLPLGYCNVGRVVAVGAGVRAFTAGDRVVSNGPHAEMVCVPATLAARVPDAVDDASAAFTVLGAVALNGIRLLAPTFGERFVVIGLGLLGLLALQILRAHGASALGIDVDPERCDLARALGAEVLCVRTGADPVRVALSFSRERGADGVLITASAKGDEIVRQAAQMARKRGRIVLVGVVGLNLRRSDFYEKELSFQVACSYGPGRYDPVYESEGRDYPLPYVRWTVARNFEAVLAAIGQGSINVGPLLSRRVAFAEAARAYEAVLSDRATLGVVLEYPPAPTPSESIIRLLPRLQPVAKSASRVRIGLVGAGDFGRRTLLPAIEAAGAHIMAIATAGGASGLQAARTFHIGSVTTDYREIFEDPDIDTVFIATRHDSHPRLVAEALDAGKHVFVEKPLAIDLDGLALVRNAAAAHPQQHLMVGFNRRFAPHAIKARALLATRSDPVTLNIRVNAGVLPPEHWTRDPAVGGGRIVGEACHFIDLAAFLIGQPIVGVQAMRAAATLSDTLSINLAFADGSIATVQYWENGPRLYPKEQIEVFSAGRALIIDNWRALRSVGWAAVPRMRMRQNKGHRAEVAAFVSSVKNGGPSLIPFADLEMVAAASFAAVRAASNGETIRLTALSSASDETGNRDPLH